MKSIDKSHKTPIDTQGSIEDLMKIKTREDLNEAIRLLGGVQIAMKQNTAECEEQLAQVRQRYAEIRTLKVGEEMVALEAREADLKDSITLYCESHREDLLEEGAKSLKLTHGEVGWRKGKDTIKPARSKVTEASLLERIVEQIIEGVRKAMSAITITKRIPITDALKVTFAWDKQGLINKLNAKTITPDDLKPFGFKLVEGEERFFVEVDEALIEGASKPKTSGKTA